MSVNRRDGNRRHTDHSDWSKNPRWAEITRPYSYADVLRLRGTIQIEYTLARLGAERLWNLMHSDAYVAALGAVTGNQAIEMVQAGLKAIYGSGWQVAADSNTAGDVYPDQSLYPCDSAPALVKRINRALLRADQIESAEGKRSGVYWFAPIVADAEAGFGGALNAYELMKAEVRAFGRESCCAHPRIHREAYGRTTCRRRLRRTYDSGCAHGRQLRPAASIRC